MRVLLAALLLLAGCQKPTSVELPPVDDRTAWRQLLKWSNDCEESFQATGSGRSGIQSFPLTGDRRLIEVACAAGAYQGSQEYFLLHGSAARPLKFRVVEDGKLKDATEITGLAEFDVKTGELKVHNRYRGLGDCGSYAIYTFPGDEARVKELREKAECDGEGAEHPERWPLRQ